MRNLTFTFIALFVSFTLVSNAQVEEHFNGPSIPVSWAVVGYSANSFSDGYWNLTTPATLNSTGYIQYNPGAGSTINTTTYKYVVINLKNTTPQTTARFYYRYNNGWIYVPLNIDPESDYKDYIIDLTTADAYSGNTDLVGKKWTYNPSDAGTYQNMPIIRFDIPSRVLAAGGIDAGSISKLVSVDYVKFLATSLPVSLSSFTVKSQSNFVKLNWTTESENNNSHFNILRSYDGITFETISSKSGNGTSTETHNYNFVDLNPVQGTNYYQLEQIDFSGKSTKSKIVAAIFGIENQEPKLIVTLDEGIKASVFSAISGQGSLFISDLSGRKISETKCNLSKGGNLIQIPSINLTPGLYVATLQNGDKTLSTKFLAH